MKKILSIFFLLISFLGMAQSITNYKYVLVPLKFDFIKTENEYRLATLSKFNLIKAGFEALYQNEELPSNTQRCDFMSFDVVKEKSFLTTKLRIVFKDCYGKLIYQSETGMSKEKEYQLAYTEALNKAFEYIYALHYKYTEAKTTNYVVEPVIKKTEAVLLGNENSQDNKSDVAKKTVTVTDSGFLYAQPIPNGFQLVDTSPKVILKVYKTSSESCFIAQKDNDKGVLILKNGLWFFEYYQNDSLQSEQIAVKF